MNATGQSSDDVRAVPENSSGTGLYAGSDLAAGVDADRSRNGRVLRSWSPVGPARCEMTILAACFTQQRFEVAVRLPNGT